MTRRPVPACGSPVATLAGAALVLAVGVPTLCLLWVAVGAAQVYAGLRRPFASAGDPTGDGAGVKGDWS